MTEYLKAQASGRHAQGLVALLKKEGMWKVPFIKCLISRGALVFYSQDTPLSRAFGISLPENKEPTTKIVLRATSPEAAKDVCQKIKDYLDRNAVGYRCLESNELFP